MNEVNKRPEFCGICGQKLIEQINYYNQGFDVYTGAKLPDRESIYIECREDHHDRWHEYMVADEKYWSRA